MKKIEKNYKKSKKNENKRKVHKNTEKMSWEKSRKFLKIYFDDF